MAKPSDDPIRIWAWINDHGRTNVSFSKPDHDATEYVRADAATPEGAQAVAWVNPESLSIAASMLKAPYYTMEWFKAWNTDNPSERATMPLYTHPERDAEDSIPNIRKVAKRNLRSLIDHGSTDKKLMLSCLEELS